MNSWYNIKVPNEIKSFLAKYVVIDNEIFGAVF